MGWTLLRSHQREFIREYGSALLNTPQIFRRIAFRRRTLEEELQEALLRGSLRKAFSGFDLIMLGLGIVVGSGWEQLTGAAAQQYAGAGIVLSYLFAGLIALLSAVCYAELCLEFPVSGGAFSYVMSTFGELPAFVALAGLLLEYALGMAAVARGFSANFAALINMQPGDVRVWVDRRDDGHSFDLLAAGVVIFMSLLLCLGVRESATFISVTTVVKLAMIVVVAVVGYAHAGWDNPDGWPYSHWQPFLVPAWDVDGVFVGASVAFFSFTGFDAIGNAAEEVQHAGQLPLAIVGTVLTSTLCYFLLALAMVLLVYPNVACPACAFFSRYASPPLVNFISAFNGHGLKCMQYFVSLTALFGIVTALTVGLFSLSRIVMAASRDWLLPPVLARISKRTQTPLVAQMVLGVIIALLALMVEVDAATGMVSFGTLIALWLVCNAQMYRRYFPDLQFRFTSYGTVETAPKQELASWAWGRHLSLKARKALVWTHLVTLNAVCIGLAVYYMQTTAPADVPLDLCATPAQAPASPAVASTLPGTVPELPATPTTPPAMATEPPPTPEWLATCNAGDKNLRHNTTPLWFVLVWLLLTLSLQLSCPLAYRPEGWHVPRWLMPWLPSAAIALLCFSIGTLPNNAFYRTAAYFGGLLAFYLAFSLPMSYIKHTRVDHAAAEECNVIELAFVGGRWQPAQQHPMFHMAPAASARTSSLQGDGTPKSASGPLGSGPTLSGRLGSAANGGSGLAMGGKPGSSSGVGPGARPGSSSRPGAGGRSSSSRGAGGHLGGSSGAGAGGGGRGEGAPPAGHTAAGAHPPAAHIPARAVRPSRSTLPSTQEGQEGSEPA